MQLHLQLSGSLCLPLAYRHYVQSMLYDALRADPEYAAALHDGAAGRQYKLFTFGQLQGKYTVADRQITFPQGAFLEIRGIHEELLLRLLRHFRVGTPVRLGSNSLTVVRCALEDRHVTAGAVTAVTRSPIVAYVTEEDGKTRFYSPEEPAFYTLVTANARRKWQSLRGEDAPFDFSISPAENTVFRKQVTQFKTTRITAWDGRFCLAGDPAVLDLLYHAGLGAKSSQGFGMFDVI